MQFKRIISAALLCAILTGLVSCSEKDDASDNNTSAETKTTSAETGTETETEAETSKYAALGLPENFDCGGETMNFLVFQNENWGWGEIVYDEVTGEQLNDAYHDRNLNVENMLNVIITQNAVPAGNVSGQFQLSVNSGDNAYAAAFARQKDAASCAMNDLCLDLNTLEYVDFSKDWWDKHSLDDLTMAGKNYLVASEISIADKDAIWVIYFDKQYINDLNLDNPYELVKSGAWTADKMVSMMQTAQSDLDGNGVYDMNDRWGLLTHAENYAASWIAAGEKLISVDKDGIPYASYNSERMVNVWDKTITLMNDNSTYSKDIGFISSGLKEGKTLFATEVVAFLRSYRDNERDFGVIPMPKYDEEQADYHTYVAEGSGLLIVPKTVSNLSTTGAVLETLAALGKDQVLSAYYDVCCRTRDVRDAESSEMLEICFNTRSYDLGVMFDWGGVASMLKLGGDSFTRVTSKRGALLERNMKQSFEKLGIFTAEE